jgi:hypothetical protein
VWVPPITVARLSVRLLLKTLDLLRGRRRVDGRWPVQQKYTGKVFFEMEPIGGLSRWNTLRALRVLRWWGD